ncbi:MAG TPA: CopD family protein [Xylella taiwanensis]
MALYFWIKSLHLLFVIAWMASVFYLPRILVNVAEVDGQSQVQARLTQMGRRLYVFGHIMFGLSFLLGLLLSFGYRIIPAFPTMVGNGTNWLHAKVGLVMLIVVHYIVSGYWLKHAERGSVLPAARTLRLFNEIPVVLLVGILWLAFAKPF